MTNVTECASCGTTDDSSHGVLCDTIEPEGTNEQAGEGSGIEMVIVSTRHFKAGYIVHHGTWKMGGSPDTPMKWAENPKGDYIGPSKDAHHLCVKRGIAPERSPLSGGSVCSIGFSEREQKWYGWSHRAIYGFGIGSVVDSDDHLCATSGYINDYLADHPEDDHRLPVGFTAATLDDARKMAEVFASAVS